MNKFIIKIATDFSHYPFGRYRKISKSSGEAFREDKLMPAMRDHDLVEVWLDGVEDYGPSFLEEVFGGLVRKHGFTASNIYKKLNIVTKNKVWTEEINKYIEDAETKR